VKLFITRIALGGVAWVSGVLAYISALGIIWHQSIYAGELIGIGELSLIAWVIAYALVYLPILLRFDRSLSQPHQFWVLPLVALPLGIVPVALVWLGIAAYLGLGRSALSLTFFSSAEASLFHWFFATSGIVVGLGLACSRPRQPSNKSLEATAGRSVKSL
jgi:hypothetical protein